MLNMPIVKSCSFPKTGMLPPNVDIATDAEIDDGFSAIAGTRRYVQGYDMEGGIAERLLWGRNLSWSLTIPVYREMLRLKDLRMETEKELSPTYCGHTVFRRPTRLYGHYFLETGAFPPKGGLSAVEIGENRVFTAYGHAPVKEQTFVAIDET